jgi:hypothetical protein
MAGTPAHYINGRSLLKGTALVLLSCLWLVFRWGGRAQAGVLLFYLVLASPNVSLVALATAAFFAELECFNIRLAVFTHVPPDAAVLVLASLASIVQGARLLDVDSGKLLGVPLSHAVVGRIKIVLALVCLGSFAAAAFKSVPLVHALSFGVLFGLGWWRLHGAARSPKTRETGRLLRATALMLLATAGASALVLEGGARMLFPNVSRPGDAFVSDPEYIFMLQPGGKGEHTVPLPGGAGKTVSLEISAQGIRDREIPPKEPGEFRIAMLGDSFTMGFSSDADTSPRQLEGRLRAAMPGARIRVINCGLAGAGVLQELGMLRKRVLPLDPDLVILELYPGNDLDNALEVVDKYQRARDVFWHQTLADYRFNNLMRVRLERWMFRHLRIYQTLRLATGKRWILSFIETLRFVPRPPAELSPKDDRPDALEMDLAQWYPELEEGLHILEDYVLQMRRECQARGIDFMAYSIPNHEELSDKEWDLATSSSNPPVQYERLKGQKLLDEFLADRSIPHVSVVEPLRKAGPIEDLYYTIDGHLTALGNTVVAKVWTDYLTGGYLKDWHARKGKK